MSHLSILPDCFEVLLQRIFRLLLVTQALL
jgi:hypothetical protein